tara:strand:- start:1024 stop:1944 length:921 start_codon:yes stop_codon:yes gene_type:complete
MAIGTAAAIAIGVGATATAVGGAVAANQAKQQAKGFKNDKERARYEIEQIKAARTPIVNPYAGVTDLSGMVSNPFANLGVATQAAEFQAEQADMSLANTLDLLATTGASAGGATALAQAALQSKKGISASIEQQEAANEQLRAQGQSEADKLKMSEQMRLQQADAAGIQYEFQAKEARTNADLGFAAGNMQQAAQNQANAKAAQGQAWGSAISGFGGALMTAGMGGFGAPTGGSDRRMKKNIKLIGKSNSGLNIYAFEYIDKIFGEGIWQGVMSDEVSKEAVIENFAGNFNGVDYSKLDVEFKRIS